MKAFLIAMICLLLCSSCFKKYSCECTDAKTGEVTKTNLSGIVHTKKQAQKTCKGYEGPDVSCVIK